MSKIGRKIDITQIDFEKEKEKVTDRPGLIAFPHHVGSVAVRPEDEGKIKGKALKAMQAQAGQQMGQLYEQMQTLAEQAKRIQKRVTVSEKIYQAKLSFQPQIGNTYYLYERNGGEHFLSMISPEEWGKKIEAYQHQATVTLLPDHTWQLDFASESF